MSKRMWANGPIPKGGWHTNEPAPGAKKVITLCFAPKEMPGAYQIARYESREEAEKEMAEYKAHQRVFTFHNMNDGKEHNTLDVDGYYQVDEEWDEYIKC